MDTTPSPRLQEEILLEWVQSFPEAVDVTCLEDLSEGSVLIHVLNSIHPVHENVADMSEPRERLKYVAMSVCNSLHKLADLRGCTLTFEEFSEQIDFNAAAEYKCLKNLKTLLLGLFACSSASRMRSLALKLPEQERRYLLRVLQEDLGLLTFVRMADFEASDRDEASEEAVNLSVQEALAVAKSPADYEAIINDQAARNDTLTCQLASSEALCTELRRELNGHSHTDEGVQCSPLPNSPGFEKVSYEALKPMLHSKEDEIASLKAQLQDALAREEEAKERERRLVDDVSISEAQVHEQKKQINNMQSFRDGNALCKKEKEVLQAEKERVEENLKHELESKVGMWREVETLRKEKAHLTQERDSALLHQQEVDVMLHSANEETLAARASEKEVKRQLRNTQVELNALNTRLMDLINKYSMSEGERVQERMLHRLDLEKMYRIFQHRYISDGLKEQERNLKTGQIDPVTSRGPSVPSTARLDQIMQTPRKSLTHRSMAGMSPRNTN